MNRYTIGLDFGTESARAVLIDVNSGELIATHLAAYPDGVIDLRLPGSQESLPPDYALQNPGDWLSTLETTVQAVVKSTGTRPEQVIGLGIDFTASTILPTTLEGVPLCQLPGFEQRRHAWPKLWKHHAAQPQAERITHLAGDRNEPWLKHYGGKISSEWLPSKALSMLEEDAQVYAAAAVILEGGDWVAWQLTGELAHNACGAGYKGLWHKRLGFPSPDYLAALNPGFSDLYQKLPGRVLPPGARLGGLSADWASRLGLQAGTPVAVPIIDAHAATLGAGVTGPNVLFMIMGTSTCHLLMAENEVFVQGIAGVVEDGIVAGLFGYEAGQAGVGDIFAWFVENAVPAEYHAEAAQRQINLHQLLSEKADRVQPGQSGLLALDWWNGNRTPLVDAELSGLLLGCTLSTRPEEIYRALIEATAFGTRWVIDTFLSQDVQVGPIVAGGGLVKNDLLMRIYAHITQREIAVAGSPQVSALGAALLGAVAAGSAAGGYDGLTQAARHMVPAPAQTYHPNPAYRDTYDQLYGGYLRLSRYFSAENPVMKNLRNLRRAVGSGI